MAACSTHQETQIMNEEAQYVNSRNYNQRENILPIIITQGLKIMKIYHMATTEKYSNHLLDSIIKILNENHP